MTKKSRYFLPDRLHPVVVVISVSVILLWINIVFLVRQNELIDNLYAKKSRFIKEELVGIIRPRDRKQTEQPEVECDPAMGKACVYPDEVDLRIIVLTFNRSKSLLTLLQSLNDMELDGDKAALEIWIDRDVDGKIDNKTETVARGFQWKQGVSTVHVQRFHAGIYGQWIYTWTPKSAQSKELALILEDDLTVSTYSYRWLRAVHGFYGGRQDFLGSSLTTDIKVHNVRYPLPRNDSVFMFRITSTWGFVPNPRMWVKFQYWFEKHVSRVDFKPYVLDILPTRWYKTFERLGRTKSMWSMWLIYFTYIEQLFTVYSNLDAVDGGTGSCLCVNRREAGLHRQPVGPICQLVHTWKQSYTEFPFEPLKFDWNGEPMPAS